MCTFRKVLLFSIDVLFFSVKELYKERVIPLQIDCRGALLLEE